MLRFAQRDADFAPGLVGDLARISHTAAETRNQKPEGSSQKAAARSQGQKPGISSAVLVSGFWFLV
jgi:hypothetical protein